MTSRRLAGRPVPWLIATVATEAGIMTWLARGGMVPIPTLLAGFALASFAYGVAVFLTTKIRLRPWLWFLVALGIRVPWMVGGLSLSDDAWRYLHDGRAQAAGVNPYRYRPADPEARGYAGPEYPRINHPELPTIYPPGAQLLFRLAVWLGGTLLSWKVLVVLADLLIGVALGMLVPRSSHRTWLMVAYWLHPLPIIEFAGNGHLDAFGILGMMIALAVGRRPVGAGAAWAASVAVKYLVLPLVPFFLRDTRAPVRWRFLAAAVGVMVVVYLPFVGVPPVGSLGTFVRNFEFNSLSFALFTAVASPDVARAAGLVGVVGVLAWSWWRRADATTATLWWLGAVLLMSPIVHPWYVTWLLPLALLRREAWGIVWSGTVILAYVVLTDYRAIGVWALPGWVLAAEYLPVLALLGWRARGLAPFQRLPALDDR